MANIMGFDNATLVGNVLTIKAGVYGGVFMTAKTISGKLTIDAKGCIFKAPIYLPEILTDTDFINFTFEGVTNTCWQWKNDKVAIGLNNVRFLNNKSVNCYAFVNIGSWGDFNQQTSMSTNLEFANNYIVKSVYNNVFSLDKCFNTKFHDNIVASSGSPAVDDKTHDGIVFIRWSDGEFWNNRISDGGGNAFRVWPAGYKKRGVVNIHDNYVVNMRKHSAVETNSDNTGKIEGDVMIKFNTFGNLAKGNYESAGIAVYLEGKPNKHSYIENNVVFNTSKGVVFYGDGSKPETEINNFYFPTSEETKIDLLTGKLLPSSPAYGKAGAFIDGGTTTSTTTTTTSTPLPVTTSTTTTTTTKSPPIVTLVVNLIDGKKFILYSDGSYTLQ